MHQSNWDSLKAPTSLHSLGFCILNGVKLLTPSADDVTSKIRPQGAVTLCDGSRSRFGAERTIDTQSWHEHVLASSGQGWTGAFRERQRDPRQGPKECLPSETLTQGGLNRG